MDSPEPVQVIVKLRVADSTPVDWLPDKPIGFDQPPEAEQPLAPLELQVKVDAFPLCTLAGLALKVTVGAVGEGPPGGGGFWLGPEGGEPPLTPVVAPPQPTSALKRMTAIAT